MEWDGTGEEDFTLSSCALKRSLLRAGELNSSKEILVNLGRKKNGIGI